ncbi:MAG TPA: hypothetical protein PKE64_23115 [Anaerolineae bacterium]|nr:hypothetical protein [Anaerolineae bacterium]HMR66912.1 hypothetical protein [Anaerolineae bacterium]
MVQSSGTLNLNIARLKYQLRVLRQQIDISMAYPHHHQKLKHAATAMELRIAELERQATLSQVETVKKLVR